MSAAVLTVGTWSFGPDGREGTSIADACLPHFSDTHKQHNFAFNRTKPRLLADGSGIHMWQTIHTPGQPRATKPPVLLRPYLLSTEVISTRGDVYYQAVQLEAAQPGEGGQMEFERTSTVVYIGQSPRVLVPGPIDLVETAIRPTALLAFIDDNLSVTVIPVPQTPVDLGTAQKIPFAGDAYEKSVLSVFS
jgi:hypothetical protein